MHGYVNYVLVFICPLAGSVVLIRVGVHGWVGRHVVWPNQMSNLQPARSALELLLGGRVSGQRPSEYIW